MDGFKKIDLDSSKDSVSEKKKPDDFAKPMKTKRKLRFSKNMRIALIAVALFVVLVVVFVLIPGLAPINPHLQRIVRQSLLQQR